MIKNIGSKVYSSAAFFVAVFLFFLFFSNHNNVFSLTLKDGDLVKTKDNSSLYLIQNGQKRIFPHLAVYLSWGLPQDFSTIKIVDDLNAYFEGDPVSFRDGSIFRGTATSLYGKSASAVFYVEGGKLRPVKSSEIYQSLFKDAQWEKVVWVPDDLLNKFAYPMGEAIEDTSRHPNGCLVRYKGTNNIYLVENGQLRLISSTEALRANRLDDKNIVEIDPIETYETATELKIGEEKLTLNIPSIADIPEDSSGQNFTFIKRYRIKDLSEARNIRQTRDGGYIFTGRGIDDIFGASSDEDAFIGKINVQGDYTWTKLFQSSHSVRIDKSISGGLKKGEEEGRDVIELKDGSFLMASQGAGFIDSAYLTKQDKNKWGDIFLSKFDKQGNHVWTRMIGDYSIDRVSRLYATEDNGFLFSGYFSEVGFGEKTAPTYFVLIKFDQNGKKKWSQKIKMKNVDIEPLPDDSFIALGDVETAGRENASAVKFGSSVVPIVVKFNAELGIEWAKSLEIVPAEESVYKTNEAGKTLMSYRTKRDSAGKFIAIRPTAGGYLALGFLSPSATGGPTWPTSEGQLPLVAVKINNSGSLEWAKTIKVNTKLGDNAREAEIAKTEDGGFAILANYLPPPRSDQENKTQVVEEALGQLNNLCEKKNRESDCSNGKIADDSGLMSAWENYIRTVKSFENHLNNGLLLVKTDSDFNPEWSKKISLEDYIYGYGIQPTSDNGVIIAGSYNTSILHYSNSLGQTYFQDTLLIKLDANGQVASDQGAISDYMDLAVKDVGPYLVLKDFSPAVESFSLKIDKQVQPKTPSSKTKIADLCAATLNMVKLVIPASLPNIALSQIPPETKSWAEINYENAENTQDIKPVYKTASQIHQELSPILDGVFDGKVKLNKDVSGGLDYIFGRLTTESDKTTVQNYLEELGYKTYLAEGDQLVMMKIGRTLTLTFSLVDRTKGTLFVTY